MHQNSSLKTIIDNFDIQGQLFADGRRNKIKLFQFEGETINIKSFKKPILINQIIYKYFRKSKARRSYENAVKLLKLGINTPKPIAFFEFFSFFGLEKSYYVCQHINVNYTFYDVLRLADDEKRFELIRKFAYFTFQLHEKGIEFLDHSPGNTLVVQNNNEVDFYLVDLNRMIFHENLSFEQRIKNLSRIATTEEVIKIISEEYCKYYKLHSDENFYNVLWNETSQFQKAFYRKIRLKKKLQFWK